MRNLRLQLKEALTKLLSKTEVLGRCPLSWQCLRPHMGRGIPEGKNTVMGNFFCLQLSLWLYPAICPG